DYFTYSSRGLRCEVLRYECRQISDLRIGVLVKRHQGTSLFDGTDQKLRHEVCHLAGKTIEFCILIPFHCVILADCNRNKSLDKFITRHVWKSDARHGFSTPNLIKASRPIR